MDEQTAQWVVNDGLQFSVVSVKAEDMANNMRPDINYDLYLQP